MKKTIILSVLVITGLAACVAADPDNYAAIEANASRGPSGKIMFYRGSNLQATLAGAYLGTTDGYFLSLDENQYSTLTVPAGFHEFKVRAQGSVAFEKQVKVNAGETVCVEARPNVEELEWLLLPFINAFIPSFVLQETACPGSAVLGGLVEIRSPSAQEA